jgi:predicted PurR-regulated permease PerM
MPAPQLAVVIGASGGNGIAFRLWTIALGAFVALLLFPFLSGLLGAAVLYVLTAPMLRRVIPLHHRRLGAFALMFLCFFALVLPGTWLLAELLAQVPDAARQLQGSAAVQRVMALRLGGLEVGTLLRQATNEIVSWSSRQTIAAIGGAVTTTLNLVIALFGAYYLLTAPASLWPRVRARLPFAPATAEALRLRFHRTTEAMVLGVIAAGVAQGVLVGVAFWMLGFPHYLLWGAATAVTSVLPIFGSALVWLPGCGVLLAHDRVGAAMALLAFGTVVVSNVDNVLRLVVYRRVSQIHPMITLVGALAGVNTFGAAGLLLGPLVLSYAIELATLAGPQGVGDSPLTPPRVADTAEGVHVLT